MEGIMYGSPSEYKNKLEPIKFYKEQIKNYIMVRKGCSEEEAEQKAIAIIKGRFKDPKLEFFLRKENGDREVKVTGLFNYIASHVRAGHIIAPSMTAYLPSKVQPSMMSTFTADNVVLRSKDKKEAAEAKAEGNKELASFKEGSQNNRKTKNNSLSGLYISSTSVVLNPTNHSTLTSMTRTMTSITNASNERMLGGNRGYYTPTAMLNGVVNEATYCNRDLIESAIQVYGLHKPNVDDVLDCLKRSGQYYVQDDSHRDRHITPYLKNLDWIGLAGILYSTDLFHLIKYNSSFMKNLFTELTLKCVSEKATLDNPKDMYKFDPSILFFAHNIFADEIKGMGVNYDRMNDAGILGHMYLTCENIANTMQKYALFFKAFFRVEIAPINSNKLQYMRRTTVVLSDTDSSGFSTDVAVKWFLDQFEVSNKSIALTGAITYLSSENIVHQLSRFSAFMNIEEHELRRMAMKNEWLWPSFTPTDVSKHYFSQAMIREGNVFDEMEMEIKGVHLKNSLVNREIIARGNAMMERYSDAIRENVKLNLDDFLLEALEIEKEVYDTTMSGSMKYLKVYNINAASSYSKDETKSNYNQHLLWKVAFADKYGNIPEPPYTAVKIPVTFESKKSLDSWLETIEDLELRSRLNTWIVMCGRNNLNNIGINQEYINDKGVPDEIKPYIDARKVVFDMTTQLRNILQSFGILLHPELLISEYLTLKLK